MKALTICQPYAALIMLPDGNQRAKRVENRTWPTSYRGPLLIHAGKSRDWIKKLPTSELKAMKLERVTFGEIIGVAQLCDCIELKQYMSRRSQQFGREALERWPWLLTHEHAHGPVCWILQDVRQFEKSIPYRGAQGLFNVPDEVVAEQLDAVSVGDRVNDMVNMDVFLTGGVGLTNGGRGWP